MAIHFVNTTREEFLNKHKRFYRFITLDKFLKCMTSKSYPFVSPLEWRDPYEKFFLERKYVVNKSTFSFKF